MEARQAMSVTDITAKIKNMLEATLDDVCVAGEVSGMRAHGSGHVYFSLKDQGAVISCVMWRSTAQRYKRLPEEGDAVTVRGRVTVYEQRGNYQIVVNTMEAKDEQGELWRRFSELKKRLQAEGLFDRKRPLPPMPKTIGIATGANTAALHDMLKIITRRSPWVRIIVSPCLVQGRGAAEDIACALGMLNHWGCDVVIVGRGGGSIEDLWAFNEEPVARAIAAMRMPVISAVGHQTDVTIADFAADVRAATPSEAAEQVTPELQTLQAAIAHAARGLTRGLTNAAALRRSRLDALRARPAYSRPADMVMARWQRIDDAADSLRTLAQTKLAAARERANVAQARLAGLSPLGVLSRGYAVVLGPDGKAVTDADAVRPGDILTSVVHKGRIQSAVCGTPAGKLF